MISDNVKQDNVVFKVLHSKIKNGVILKARIIESVSALTEMDLYFKTREHVDVANLPGTKVAIEVTYDNKKGYTAEGAQKRYFSGTIVSASFEVVPILKDDSVSKNNILYMKVLSTFGISDYIRTYRTFIKKKPKEIIEDVLRKSGIADVKLNISGGSERQLTTQYDETNFHFVSRLMEENGYFYFFDCEKDKDTLHIVDQNSVCNKIQTKLTARQIMEKIDFNNVYNISFSHALSAQKVSLTSYDVKTAKPVSSKEMNQNQKIGSVDLFDKVFATKNDGDKIARLETERVAALDYHINADSICCEISAGCLCNISDAEDKNCNGEFFVISVEHKIDYTGSADQCYTNHFVAVKKNVVYRPPCVHLKPVKHGSYIATVVDGNAEINKEIDVDDALMVLIAFPFGLTSRVRYTNIAANNKFGANVIPRPGTEVLVIFANGNIDNPVIIGSLYNGVNRPHDDCVAPEVTSFTTKTIDGDGYNQVIFDDTKDNERIQFHAQTDWIVNVDQGSSYEIISSGNKVVALSNSDDETTNTLSISKGDNIIQIDEGNQKTILKKGNCEIEITEGDQQITLKKGDYTLEIADGKLQIATKKDVVINVGENLKIVADKDIAIKSNGKFSIEASKDISIKSNANIAITAAQKINVKATQDFVAEGANLSLQAKINAEIKANVQLKISGTMANVEAKAMLGLKGAIVNVG